MRKSFTKVALLVLTASSVLVACKKETVETTQPNYTVPTTYDFANPDSTTSKQHIAMLAEITTYIKTTHSNTAAPVLDAQKLKDMFTNVNLQFTNPTLNLGVSLKSKAALSFHAALEANFDASVEASQNAGVNPTGSTAYNGHAGKLINGTRYVLVDENGVEFKEFAEKGLMGAVYYYQAATILNNINSYDNTVETNGTTAQERAWDQAFFYFGVPVNFPQVTTGLKNWGSYCNSVSNALAGNSSNGNSSLNSQIMKAWIAGRAAISNGDNVRRNMAAADVLENWEKVIAARFITYTKGALNNIAEPATYHHNLSEAVGFIEAFQYNNNKSISDADIAILMSYFENANGTVNLYQVTTGDLNNAIDKMATVFGLDASKL